MPNKVKVTIDNDLKPSVILNGKDIDDVKGVSWGTNSEGKKTVKVEFAADEVIEIRKDGLVSLEDRYLRFGENLLITRWREHPEMHEAIMKLLGM